MGFRRDFVLGRGRFGVISSGGQVNLHLGCFCVAFKRGFVGVGPLGFRPCWFTLGTYR